jgi:hypothetical protein
MHYILVIDGEETLRDRMINFSSNISDILSNIEIYWAFKNNNKYNFKHYLASDHIFEEVKILPLQGATLAFWHYRDPDYEFHIKPEIIVGFGGNGREINKILSIGYHITSPIDSRNRLAAIDPQDIKELFDWACDVNRSQSKLPKLISSPDYALLALKILCQGYLKYQSQAIDSKAIERQWWTDPFRNIENMQNCLTQYTKKINNSVSELIEIIQKDDLDSDANKHKLQQLCLQLLQLKE